jgi:acyl transferase domain-containing protein
VAMEKGVIPANLHFQTPNPDIDFTGMHLSVVAKTIPWPSCEKKVRRRDEEREIGERRGRKGGSTDHYP